MRDFAKSPYQNRKVAANKIRVPRKQLDLKKYLLPLVRILPMFVGSVVVCALIYVGYRSFGSATFFRLKNIEVSSTRHITRDEILALAGVEPGRNLARLNLKRMGEQLALNPWAETVKVHRYFPDRLTITITEREPLAIVNMGFIYYLDKKGTVFKVLNQGDRLDYPVITGFSEDEMTRNPAGTRDALKTTCELIGVLRERGSFILADVSEIHYDKGYGFTLFTASGALPVKVGSGNFTAKVDRFARIYRDLMTQRASLQYIDLDYNDKIVIKKS